MRVLSYSGTSHVCFARFGSRNATRSLVGQSGIFLKMQLQGESWDNLGELGRAAEICGDLWRAYSALWKLLVSRQLRMKSKENAWTCNVSTSDFRIVSFCGRCFPMASHWNQMASNRLTRGGGGDIRHTYPLHLTNLWPFKCHEKPCAAITKKHVLVFLFFRSKI